MNQMIPEDENLQNLSKDSALLLGPIVRVTPRNAMYANREQVRLQDALHRISRRDNCLLSSRDV